MKRTWKFYKVNLVGQIDMFSETPSFTGLQDFKTNSKYQAEESRKASESGSLQAVEVSLKCNRCGLFYEYSKHGILEIGWSFYPQDRSAIKVSDVCFLQRSLLKWQISLAMESSSLRRIDSLHNHPRHIIETAQHKITFAEDIPVSDNKTKESDGVFNVKSTFEEEEKNNEPKDWSVLIADEVKVVNKTQWNAINNVTQSNPNTPVIQSNSNTEVTQSNTNTAVTQSNSNTTVTQSNSNTAVTQSNTNTAVTQSNSNTEVTQSNTNTVVFELDLVTAVFELDWVTVVFELDWVTAVFGLDWVTVVFVLDWVTAVFVLDWVTAVFELDWVTVVFVLDWVTAVFVLDWVTAVFGLDWVTVVFVLDWVTAVFVLDWVTAVFELDWVTAVFELDWVTVVFELDWVTAVFVLDWVTSVFELDWVTAVFVLDWVTSVFELDWVTAVIFQKLCSGASAADKCTLYSDRNLTNQRNVKDDVTAAANACRSFLQLEVEIQVIAAAIEPLSMKSLDEENSTKNMPLNHDGATTDARKAYLRGIASLATFIQLWTM
ncbi:hypothetical protein ACROYT_G014447 [Oculina patagonica]